MNEIIQDDLNQQISDNSLIELNPNKLQDAFDKLWHIKKKSQKNEDEFKQKYLHQETVSIMSKYQLVFMKLDFTLQNLNKIFQLRDKQMFFKSFQRMKELHLKNHMKQKNKDKQNKIIFQKMQAIFTNLHILVYSIQKRNKIQGLGKIKMMPAKDHKFQLNASKALIKLSKQCSHSNDINQKQLEYLQKQQKAIIVSIQNEKIQLQAFKCINQQNQIKIESFQVQLKMIANIQDYQIQSAMDKIYQLKSENIDIICEINNTEQYMENFIKDVQQMLIHYDPFKIKPNNQLKNKQTTPVTFNSYKSLIEFKTPTNKSYKN